MLGIRQHDHVGYAEDWQVPTATLTWEAGLCWPRHPLARSCLPTAGGSSLQPELLRRECHLGSHQSAARSWSCRLLCPVSKKSSLGTATAMGRLCQSPPNFFHDPRALSRQPQNST